MRVRYKSLCVKFREDDPLQVKAWEYLKSHGNRKSYSQIIAEAISGLDENTAEQTEKAGSCQWLEERFAEIKGICSSIYEKIESGMIPDDKERHNNAAVDEVEVKGTMPQGILEMALSMGDCDDD